MTARDAAPGWPCGESGMARLIREHDWTATSLGPLAAWPERLRAAVELMLASPQVASLAVGPERVLLYNDMAARLYGARGPEVLGRPLAEAFPEGYPAVTPLYDRAFAGEAVEVPARPVAVSEAGGEVFEAVLVPVRGADGTVIAVQMTGTEMSARKRAEAELREREERQAFLLRFSDALRAEPDVDAVANRAIRMLAEQMDLDRCCITVHRPEDDEAVFPYQVGNDTVPPLPAKVRLSDFPDAYEQVLRGTFMVDDDAERRGPSEVERANSKALGMRAMLASTIRRGERTPLASIVAVSSQARRWTPGEIALVEEAAERTWAAMERARAEAALRASEARQAFLLRLSDALRPLTETDRIQKTAARLLAEHLGAVRVHYVEALPEDQDLLRAGPGYVAGVPQITGILRISDFDDEAQTTYRAGRTLVIPDVEAGNRSEAQLAAFRVLGIRAVLGVPLAKAGRLIGILSVHHGEPHDWTPEERVLVEQTAERTWEALERARAEAALRESEDRQAFLLKLGDALRALAEPAEIIGTATRLLGEWLGASRAYFVEWPPGADHGEITQDYATPGLASLAGRYPIEAFRSAYERVSQGTTWVVEDNATEPGISDVERRYHQQAGIIAWVDVPLTRGAQPVAVLCVVQDRPRKWTATESYLAEETASRCWAAIERARSETALRESEERFRTIVETATDYAIFTADAEGRIETWPQGAREVFGWSAEEAVGRPVDITFTPEDRLAGEPAKERRQAREEGQAPDVRWHLRKDGSRVFIDGMVRPLKGPDGAPAGFLKVGQDVTQQRATEAALQESEARFRQFGDASADVLWIRDAETLAVEYISPAFEEIYGTKIEHVLDGNHVRRWAELILPEDRDLALDHLRRVREGEHVLHAFRILRADGRVRWIRDTSFPLLDAEGRVQRLGGIAHDATEAVELQDRLRVLVAELQHRSRNLVTVVRGVTDRTLATSATLEEFRSRIRERLAALGRVNALLSRLEEGDRVTFDQLLQAELTAHGVLDEAGHGPQATLRGPGGIRLRSATVQTFALAIHELATNALKHGALSRPEGHLEVSWSLLPGKGAERRLRVDWRETGVPVVLHDGVSGQAEEAVDGTPVPRRRGYGRELIERALPYQLKAQTSYELTPEGVRCTIVVPVSSTLDLAFSAHGGDDD